MSCKFYLSLAALLAVVAYPDSVCAQSSPFGSSGSGMFGGGSSSMGGGMGSGGMGSSSGMGFGSSSGGMGFGSSSGGMGFGSSSGGQSGFGFGTTQGNSQGGGFVGTTAQQASQNFVGAGQSLLNNQSGGYSSGMSGMSSMGGGMGMSGMSGMGGMGMSGMGGGMGGMGGYSQNGRGGQYGMGGTSPQSNPAAQVRMQIAIAFPRARGVASSQVSTAFAGRLATLPALHWSSPPKVEMQGRTAVLRGTVATEHDRDLAERVARLEPTVSQVVNLLAVAGAAPAGSGATNSSLPALADSAPGSIGPAGSQPATGTPGSTPATAGQPAGR
jgi:BON domain